MSIRCSGCDCCWGCASPCPVCASENELVRLRDIVMVAKKLRSLFIFSNNNVRNKERKRVMHDFDKAVVTNKN